VEDCGAIFHRLDNGEPFADCAKCEALNRPSAHCEVPRDHLARLLVNWFRQARLLAFFFGSTMARLSLARSTRRTRIRSAKSS
jgi:hypothetical protein